MLHKLNERELATVLAALRHYQATFVATNAEIDDIATNGGTLNRLTRTEVDSLCERLNS